MRCWNGLTVGGKRSTRYLDAKVSEIQLQTLRDEQSATTTAILTELAAIAVDTEALKGQPLRVVIEAAATCEKRHEKTASHRRTARRKASKNQA